MKNLFKRLPKKVLSIFTAAVLLMGMTVPAMAAFGPSRPTKAWSPTVDGFDHVTFNSFTGVGNGIGDERDFMRGLQVGRDSAWSDPVNNVTQNAEVEGKIYIHNNADARLNDAPGQPGIARNVKVSLTVPTAMAQSQDLTSHISADNAQPQSIFDTLTITGANNGFFSLQYEPGFAQLHDQFGHTTRLTNAQENAFITNGVNIGDQKGCFQYVREITFRVQVKMPRYTINKQVRFAGQTSKDWKKEVDSKQGDTLEWMITFTNTGKTPLNHIKIVDNVPVGLDVVPATVKLINGNFPSGFVYSSNAVQANGRQINVDIGNYNPTILAYVLFRTKVDKPTTCSVTTLVNKAFATPEGLGSIFETAKTNVTGERCKTPPKHTKPPKKIVVTKQLVNTGPGDVVAIFMVTTLAGAVGFRLYALRKLSR